MLRLNPDLYAALEKWAADEFRSVNGQVEWLLDRALRERGRAPVKPYKKQLPDDTLEKNRTTEGEPSAASH